MVRRFSGLSFNTVKRPNNIATIRGRAPTDDSSQAPPRAPTTSGTSMPPSTSCPLSRMGSSVPGGLRGGAAPADGEGGRTNGGDGGTMSNTANQMSVRLLGRPIFRWLQCSQICEMMVPYSDEYRRLFHTCPLIELGLLPRKRRFLAMHIWLCPLPTPSPLQRNRSRGRPAIVVPFGRGP
jgi:hypothetical protein